MKRPNWSKRILTILMAILICNIGFANEDIFRQARNLQRDGKYDEAIETFKSYLSQPIDENISD